MLFQRASTHFVDWNVWLKEKGYKARAQGESYPDGAKGHGEAGGGQKQTSKIDEEDVADAQRVMRQRELNE